MLRMLVLLAILSAPAVAMARPCEVLEVTLSSDDSTVDARLHELRLDRGPFAGLGMRIGKRHARDVAFGTHWRIELAGQHVVDLSLEWRARELDVVPWLVLMVVAPQPNDFTPMKGASLMLSWWDMSRDEERLVVATCASASR
jgi:hypothetical protein